MIQGVYGVAVPINAFFTSLSTFLMLNMELTAQMVKAFEQWLCIGGGLQLGHRNNGYLHTV